MNNVIDWDNVQAHELKGGFAIQDSEITAQLSTYLSNYNWTPFLKNDGRLDDVREEYISTFRTWIHSSTNNKINLGPFSHATITNGTSEAFQMFMQRHNHRTFKFREGELIMHKITANNMNLDWAFLNDDEFAPHDAFIASVPYSNLCDISSVNRLKTLLVHCNKMKIPVLLDLAYFGTVSDIELDLSDPLFSCVEDVVFSLGKTFPLIGSRPGIRFQRRVTDDAVYFGNQHGIVNNFACVAGTHAMKSFDADYIYNKYIGVANTVARSLNAENTASIIFASSLDTRYESIQRVPYEKTRLCISNFITRIYNDG